MSNVTPKTPVNTAKSVHIEEAEQMAKHIIRKDSETQNEMLKVIFSIVQNERASKIEALEESLMIERQLMNDLKYE